MDDYESVALVKPEVFVYRIPPISSNTGHKAADWKLDQPDWTGRLKLVAIGRNLELRLEDKSSGALYAKCPIDAYPGQAIEAVKDSSRYFVIRLRNDAGQTAFVGCGFADRSDSFDLNDHFKYIEKSAELEQKFNNSGPPLDLAFKEGQTISISLKKSDGQASTSRPRPATGSSTGGPVPLLPPPPSAGSSVRSRGTTTVPKPSGNTNDSLLYMDLNNRLVQLPERSNFEMFPKPSGQATPIATRRLQKDYQKLLQEPLPGIHAVPSDKNILEWHYVIEGSRETPYEGGYYHGKIVFQPDFPWKPPAICMVTPNGRFKINMRLCLSISDYHPESWNPGWTVSSILIGLHSFMNEDTIAAGAIDDPIDVRKRLAAESIQFNLTNPEFCQMFPHLTERLKKTVRTASSATTYNSSLSHSLRKRESSSALDEPVAKKNQTEIIDLTDE